MPRLARVERSQGEPPNNEYKSFDERVLGGGLIPIWSGVSRGDAVIYLSINTFSAYDTFHTCHATPRLKRSQGEHQNNEYESFDERVLGRGNFVDALKQEIVLRDKMKSAVSLTLLLEIVSANLMLDPELVRRPSKSRSPVPPAT